MLVHPSPSIINSTSSSPCSCLFKIPSSFKTFNSLNCFQVVLLVGDKILESVVRAYRSPVRSCVLLSLEKYASAYSLTERWPSLHPYTYSCGLFWMANWMVTFPLWPHSNLLLTTYNIMLSLSLEWLSNCASDGLRELSLVYACIVSTRFSLNSEHRHSLCQHWRQVDSGNCFLRSFLGSSHPTGPVWPVDSNQPLSLHSVCQKSKLLIQQAPSRTRARKSGVYFVLYSMLYMHMAVKIDRGAFGLWGFEDQSIIRGI